MKSRGPVAVFIATSIALGAYLFPYFHLPTTWWRTLPSSCALLLVGAAFWRRDMPRTFGIAMSAKDLVWSGLAFVGLLALFSRALPAYVFVEPLSAQPHDYIPGYVHQFFQVFNDEILLRGAVLTLLLRVVSSRWIVVFLPAVFFAVAHHVVYRAQAEVGGPALVTIFAFAVVANALFVRVGHIGYGFALHYAWNLYRFGRSYHVGGASLSEGASFNYIEGSSVVVVASLLTAALVLMAASGFLSRDPRAALFPRHRASAPMPGTSARGVSPARVER